jgi:uncharacterized protein (TIGR00369 family)
MTDGEPPTANDLHADAGGHFISTMRVEFGEEPDDRHAVGAVVLDPYLQADGLGWPNMATLLTLADVLIGRLASHHTRPRISVTSDLGVRLFRRAIDQRVECRARLLKVGRTMSVGDAEFFSASGELIGTALGTFLASPRPADVAPHGFQFGPQVEIRRSRTLAEHVGITTPEPGVAEMPALRSDLTNATQSLQGGIVALLGEMATYSAVASGDVGSQVVDTLEVHYLSAGRTGPFRATAEGLSLTTTTGYFRVQVRDLGRDRLTAIIETTTRPTAP